MSASFDYAALKAAVPDVLIPQFGIPVTLTRQSRAPAKSWEQDQGPTDKTAAQSFTVSGVQVALDKATLALETTETRLGRWAITVPATTTSFGTEIIPEEMGPEWKLTAAGKSYVVSSVTPVQPGDTLLMYFVVVRL